MKLIFIFVSCTYICVLSQLIFLSCHSCSSTRWVARRCKREEALSATWSRYVPSEKQGQFLTLPKCWQLLHSEWKIDATFWPAQSYGNFVQKLKAGAAAEAKGEENPGLLADNSISNNNNNVNNINNNTSNNNKRKGKRNGFKTLVKKEQVSSADIQKHSTSKKATEPESQNPALPVDWSSWDAS